MATRENDTERALLPGALLVGAVVLILGAGFVLSTGAPKEIRQTPLPPPRPAVTMPVPVPGVEAPAEEPKMVEEPVASPPVLAPETAPSNLSTRSVGDLRRLGQSSGRYTAQLVVACKPETVERLIEAAQGSKSLYVLPAQVKGQSCFRVCWGSYGSSDEAAKAGDLPASLRSAEHPRAVEIVSVLP